MTCKTGRESESHLTLVGADYWYCLHWGACRGISRSSQWGAIFMSYGRDIQYDWAKFMSTKKRHEKIKTRNGNLTTWWTLANAVVHVGVNMEGGGIVVPWSGVTKIATALVCLVGLVSVVSCRLTSPSDMPCRHANMPTMCHETCWQCEQCRDLPKMISEDICPNILVLR